MNIKIISFYLAFSFLISVISFSAYSFLGIDDYMEVTMEKISSDENYALKFRIVNITLVVAFGALNSAICFRLAKKKGKDPWQWAKYGFFFNLYAITYLLLFAKPDYDSNNV